MTVQKAVDTGMYSIKYAILNNTIEIEINQPYQ